MLVWYQDDSLGTTLSSDKLYDKQIMVENKAEKSHQETENKKIQMWKIDQVIFSTLIIG